MRLTQQVQAKVVDLMLLVLILLVTMVQELELMMKEILGNTNNVNIQWAHFPMKMISLTAHEMNTMALEKLV